MNKLYFFMILNMISISLTSATLTISPQPLDISQKVNSEGTFQMTLTNNYNMKIMDFEFGDLSTRGFTFPNIEINSNETKTIDFTFSPTESAHENIQVPISFKYEVELPETQRTHEINITSSGFSPNHLDIRQDDTILWINKDSLSHTVTGALFDQSLLPNETFSYSFNQITTINYQDLNLFHAGTINILNKTTLEKAHNPNYDRNWVINLNTILNPTNLTISNSKENYEVEYMKFKKGLLTIEDSGSEKAELIELSSDSDWITFNKNNIDIEPGDTDWIEYTITPIVFSTNATDKTYELSIKIKASNSEEYTESINVFVPFKEITNDLGGSDVDTLNWLTNVFCPKFPTSFLCNQSITYGNDSIIYQDLEVPINVSAQTLYESFRREQANADALARTNNLLAQLGDKYGSVMPSIDNQLNISLQASEEALKRSKRTNNAVWIIGFFMLLIGLVGATIKIFNKKSYKKDLMEGAFSYRR